MKAEKVFSALWGCLLAFIISLASVGCIVTGFHMEVNLTRCALWCAVAAVGSSVCYTLPLGPVPICTVAISGCALWWAGDLKLSFQALLYRISQAYNSAYGWGVLRLNRLTAHDMEPTLWLILCFLGAGIAVAVSWGICRRKTAFPGVLMAALCLGSCMVSKNTVPDGIGLWFFLFGVLLMMLTHTVRREDGPRGNRLTVLTAVPLAVCLLILFGAVPQNSYQGQKTAQAWVDAVLKNSFVQSVFGDLTEKGTSGSSVDSGIVQLDMVGVRLESRAEILEVDTEYTGVLYLRGRSLDAYDGRTWTDSGVSTALLYWPEKQQMEPVGEVSIKTRYAHRVLYLPYYVQSMDLTDVTRGIENTEKLTQYSITTARLPIESIMADKEQETQQDISRYLHLSESVQKWAVPLAQEITGEKSSVYEQAQAIGNYVKNSAKYSLNTAAMPSYKTDFVKWFLESSDTGYCVHFASAATVLLQAAGIPARYITGYMTDVQENCVTLVRSEDAHAWVEYWIPGFGWTMLEVTPAAQTEVEEDNTAALPDNTDVAFNWRILGWVSVVVLSAVMIGIILQRYVRLYFRRKKLDRGDLTQRILAYWQETVAFAACLGEKPDEQLFTIAQKAKFSSHTPQEEELELFITYLQGARRKLQRHSLFHKFYYRFILVLY